MKKLTDLYDEMFNLIGENETFMANSTCGPVYNEQVN